MDRGGENDHQEEITMAKFGWKSFVGGLLVGTIGLELIRSKNADKNFFVPVTTGVLVAKDWVMERIEKVQGLLRQRHRRIRRGSDAI